MSSKNDLDKIDKELELLDRWIHEEKILFPLDEGETISLYRNTTYLLAKIYWRVDWSKIAKSRKIRSEDVFQHKIKVAGAMSSCPRVVDKLCNLLSLQNVAVHSRVIDDLEKDKKGFLRILREESIYISRKAIELTQLFKQAQ